MSLFKSLSLVAAITLFSVGCGDSTVSDDKNVIIKNIYGNKYDINGKILVEKLSDSERYTINGSIFKRYSNELDKIKDIKQNFNNIYNIEINNPDIIPELTNSIFDKLTKISTVEEINKWNSDVKLLVYRMKDNKEFNIGNIIKLIKKENIELTKKIQDIELSGIERNVMIENISPLLIKLIDEDVNNLNIIDERFLDTSSIGKMFDAKLMKYSDIKNPTSFIQKAHLLSKNIKDSFDRNRYDKDISKEYPNFLEIINSLNEKELSNKLKEIYLNTYKNLTFKYFIESKASLITRENLSNYLDYDKISKEFSDFVKTNNLDEQKYLLLFKNYTRMLEDLLMTNESYKDLMSTRESFLKYLFENNMVESFCKITAHGLSKNIDDINKIIESDCKKAQEDSIKKFSK